MLAVFSNSPAKKGRNLAQSGEIPESLKEEIVRLREEVARYKDATDIDGSETRRRAKEAEDKARSQETIRELKSELKSERETREEVEVRHRGLVEQYQSQQSYQEKLEEKNRQNSAKIEEQATQIKELHAENSKLKAKISDDETQFREKCQKYEEVIFCSQSVQKIKEQGFKEENTRLKGTIGELVCQISRMSETFEEEVNKNKTLRTQLSEKDSKIENLEKDLSDKKKTIEDLKEEIAEKNKGHGSVLKCHTARVSKTNRALIGAAVGATVAAAVCITALAFVHVAFPPIILVTGTIAIVALASVAGGLGGYHASKISAAIKGVFYREAGTDNAVVQNKLFQQINSDPRSIAA